MLPDPHRTIVALASGAQAAQRAIVRLAGPDTAAILKALCRNPLGQEALPDDFLQSRRLGWCETQAYLPKVRRSLPLTLLYWPDSRSYTGCPAAELHLIGSLPLAEALIDYCCQLGASVAMRGEFTLRAFLAGKLDLAQAEAVLGVINADSQDTLANALAQLGGNLAPAVAPLRDTVVGALAELEAGLDFVDEDIQFIAPEQLLRQLRGVQQQIAHFAARLNTRSRTDSAAKVVLVGLPNSGKSTLFNRLTNQELAIVADVPGTTRDFLLHRLTVNGIVFDLMDTAGWELLGDQSPRALAQNQLAQCLASADLALLCLDVSNPMAHTGVHQFLRDAGTKVAAWMVVGTKSDQSTSTESPMVNQAARYFGVAVGNQVITSERDPASIERLRGAIALAVQELRRDSVVDPLALVHETAIRCRSALASASSSLAAAIELVEEGGGEELVAAELRLVVEYLSTIIGDVHSDDILGEIFSRFCIGK